MTRVLVVGLPRSGTTWVANVLGRHPGSVVVQEPDNPDANPLARPVQAARGLHPVLRPGDEAPDYEQLWRLAYQGGWPTAPALVALGRGAKRLPAPMVDTLLRLAAALTSRWRRAPTVAIAKSVLVTFCLEWVVERFQPQVVTVERDPLNVVASWLTMDIPLGGVDSDPTIRATYADALGIEPLPAGADRLTRTAWCVGLLMAVSQRDQAAHPERPVVSHEELCAAPARRFSDLFDRLGLTWAPAVERYLDEVNQPGTGYTTNRVTVEAARAWEKVLTSEDAARTRRVIDAFPLRS